MILFILISLIIFLLFVSRYYKDRHYRNFIKAKKIYKLINTFENNSKIFFYLRKIDPFVFEELILLAFRKKGYKIIRNRKYTGDGGIDGRVIINGKIYLIQVKRYKNYISAEHIHNFIDLCKFENKHGFFIHTGKTGALSSTYLENNDLVEIISGNKLINLLRN